MNEFSKTEWSWWDLKKQGAVALGLAGSLLLVSCGDDPGVGASSVLPDAGLPLSPKAEVVPLPTPASSEPEEARPTLSIRVPPAKAVSEVSAVPVVEPAHPPESTIPLEPLSGRGMTVAAIDEPIFANQPEVKEISREPPGQQKQVETGKAGSDPAEPKIPAAVVVEEPPVPVQARRALPVSPPPPTSAFNAMVLRAVEEMPKKGSYAVSRAATVALREAVTLSKGGVKVIPKNAVPSFCSGATYLVFLEALVRGCDKARVKISAGAASALLVAGQPDGQGIWGRWNANGPGTARLFHESGLGVNFDNWEHAQPGDFMKVFWNENIGKRERGHSVIFLGVVPMADGETGVEFWSSNIPEGYGRKVVPMSSVKRVLFSRLLSPAAVNKLPALPPKDTYLADMLKRDSNGQEMLEMVGAGE
jgi:hypothetical protein